MDLAKLRDEPIRQLIRRKLQYSIFRQKWNIGITRHSGAVVAGLEGARRQRQALDDLLWMDERRDAYAADPFIIRCPGNQENYLIFFEHYLWRRQRGTIQCVEFRNGIFGVSKLSLESRCHLSYPYIFPYLEDTVIMPEHSESGDLSLYKFDDLGKIYNKETIGKSLNFLDSTVIYCNKKYWIFTTHAGPNENRDLYLYYTDDLKAPWSMHPQNPVKRDVSSARPAGQFISHAGKMFRPAQDCRTHYGSGIIINELKTLTEETFEEVPVSEIRPEVGSRYEYGLHTISSAGDYTVLDGARIESSIHPSLDRFGRYFLTQKGRGAATG